MIGLLTVLVVLDATPVAAGAGGRPLAKLASGVELEARGPARGAWTPVRLAGPVSLEGFVHSDHLGCRAGADVELTPVGKAPPAKLRRGALLRRFRARGELLEVATIGPVSVRGTIPATACVVPGTAYYDETPSEGELRTIDAGADLRDAPDGQVLSRLAAGTRFVVRESREGWAGGRTDGPVVVAGWVLASALGAAPAGSPLDILTRPLDHTHEVLATTRLASRRAGRPGAVEVEGGAPVEVLEAVAGQTRIRTVGPVVAEGWVPDAMVREVTTSEESIELPGGATRRIPPPRGPRLVVP